MLARVGTMIGNLRHSWRSALACAAAACALLFGEALVIAQARAPGGAAPPAAGDATRGKALFESSGCYDCHRIDTRGSRLGPNLSDIGGRRTPDRLRQALVAPDEEVLPENRFARIVTKDGATVTGRLINQDAISVQVMTPKEELKSYLRAGLKEYTILEKGLMPGVQGKLTDQQVNDVVAYLSSLKAPDAGRGN